MHFIKKKTRFICGVSYSIIVIGVAEAVTQFSEENRITDCYLFLFH